MDDATPLIVPNSTVGDGATDHDMTCVPGHTSKPSRWALPLRVLSVAGFPRKLNSGQANSTGAASENNLMGTHHGILYECVMLNIL